MKCIKVPSKYTKKFLKSFTLELCRLDGYSVGYTSAYVHLARW